MARMIQNNFGGGEISPVLSGRSDLSVYYKGCADAENFLISKEGTLRKRPGIHTFASVEDYAHTKVVPYKYDRTEGGFLVIRREASGFACDFYRKGDNAPRSSVTDFSFAGDVSAIQAKQIGDQVWITNGADSRYITVTDNSTISISEWKQTEIPPPIPHNDTLNAPTTHWSIVRSSTKSGRTISYAVISAKDAVNSDTSKGECTWSSTWEAATYIDLSCTIALEDKSKWSYIIFCKRSGGTYGELTRAYMDDTPDTYLYIKSGTELAIAYKWSDGKFYDKAESSDVTGQVEVTVTHHRYTFRDENHTPSDPVYGQTNVLGEGFANPLCIDCFQQRRVFANARVGDDAFPMTLWFSEVGNLDNFFADRPSEDSDAFSPTISSTGPSFIRWICCYQDNMILLTDCGMFSVGFAQTQGFGASTCRISRFSQISVSDTIQPIVTDAGVVFVGGDDKTLYTAQFDLQENALKPINRSVLVEHLTRNSKIRSIGLQEFPDNVIWCATDDGKACTFVFERNEDVYAWSHHRIAGAEIVDVIALGTVTDGDGGRSYGDMIFVVRRGSLCYLARFGDDYFDRVNGKESAVHARLVTLRPESQERTLVGMKKNIKDVLVRVYESGTLCARNNLGDRVVIRSMDEPYTGDIKIMPRGLINEEGQLEIVSPDPSACEILQVVTTIEVA